MDNFKEKIESFRKIQLEVDDYVWEVFYSYIAQEKINFSSPKNWNIDEDDTDIYFTGADGCMGCYDNKSLSIPLSFFINPKSELSRLKNERLAQEVKRERKAKTAARKKDRQTFERLKKRFA